MLQAGTSPNQTYTLTGAVIPGYEAQYNTPKLRASTGKMIAAAISSLHQVTPLMIAAGSGYTDIVQILLAHGADVKAVDSRGWTALMAAVAYNRYEPAKVLIAAGSGIADRDRRQWTPLMVAAGAGAVNCIKLLVDSGAKLEDRDVNGFTSLARACTAGSVPAVKYLVEKHADVHAVNAAGKGMVYLARNRGHYEIADLLKSYGVQDQRGPDDLRRTNN
jgi:ankyrin repeat protein